MSGIPLIHGGPDHGRTVLEREGFGALATLCIGSNEDVAQRLIDDSRLPKLAVIIGQPRSFYREHKEIIWTLAIFILGQSLAIAVFTFYFTGQLMTRPFEEEKA